MTQDNFPDKCNLCGLKQTWPLNTDAKFQEINALFKKGIIKKRFIRKMHAVLSTDGGDKDDIAEFCLISHPDFNKKLTKCDAWQLDVGLPKGDCLALYLAEEMRYLTKKIHILTGVVVILTLLQIYLLIGLKIQELIEALILKL